jgi:hypothetical protein
VNTYRPNVSKIEPHEVAPLGHAAIEATVHAKTIHHAVEQAVFAIDLLRAIWNLPINAAAQFRLSSTPYDPVNRIRFERVHTLHQGDGPLAHAQFWYEPAYVGRRQPYGPRWDFLRRQELDAQRQLGKLKYRDELALLLVRRVRALDLPDRESSFLQLWSVLEDVTGTQEARHEDTVRRAAFIFSDPEPRLRYCLPTCLTRDGPTA